MKHLLARLSLGATLALSISCGDTEIQYVQDFRYDVERNQVSLEVEFNQDLTLNTDITVPILNYGYVSLLSSDDEHGIIINTTLNLDALLDEDIMGLDRTRRLPNGQPMSTYVKSDVGRFWIKSSDDVAVSVYFGLEPEEFYLGSAVELGFLDDNFPAGLVLSQRIRDHLGRMLGVVTLFGPKVNNGRVVAPGGIYFISNVTDLVSYIRDAKNNKQFVENSPESKEVEYSTKLMPENETFINIKEYKSREKQYDLYKTFKRMGKKAGYMD